MGPAAGPAAEYQRKLPDLAVLLFCVKKKFNIDEGAPGGKSYTIDHFSSDNFIS
jgi:hypothetical protein